MSWVVLITWCRCVSVRGVSWWGMYMCRWWDMVDRSLMCFDVATMACGGSASVGWSTVGVWVRVSEYL